MKRPACFLAIVMLAALHVVAVADENVLSESGRDDLQLAISIDRRTAAVAEPLRLSLQVTAPRGSVVAPPQLESDLGPFTIQQIRFLKDLPASADGQRRMWRVELVLDSLKSGELTIPSIQLPYRLADSTQDEVVRSEPIAVRITSLLEDRADPTDFRELKGLIDVPVPETASTSWKSYAAAAVAVVGCLSSAVLIYRRRRKPVPPSVWAFAQIEQLENLLDSEQVSGDAVYTELTSILRQYFLDWAGLRLDESLSDTVNVVNSQDEKPQTSGGLPADVQQSLAQFMRLADQVRFAKLPLSDSQIRDSIDQSRAIIRRCATADHDTAREAA